jgi:hypothetical protein
MNAPTLIPHALTANAARYRDALRALSGVDPLDRRRLRPAVVGRILLVRRLSDEGFTLHQIGNAIGWDHATIHFYRRRSDAFLSLPGYEAERDLWNDFNKAIEICN